MNSLLFLLTVPLWEQIGAGRFRLALVCFALAGLCGLVSGAIHLFMESRRRLGAMLSSVGLVLGLIPLTLAWQVRDVVFQPVADASGAAQAPSLVEALLVPLLPVLFNAALLLAHRATPSAEAR
jgi:hypothetical protein